MGLRHGVVTGMIVALGLVFPGGGGHATTFAFLHVYSSMPLAGSEAADAADVVRGEQVALDADPAAGVVLRSLNDATSRAGGWDPGRVAQDARDAASDQTAIGYIGEFNSGASAISIPILNEAGLLQISPDNTYPGLTGRAGTPEPGEPLKFYPTGRRTFGRLVPTDAVEARALATEISAQHVRRLLIVDDRNLYGHELAVVLRRDIAGTGVRTAGPVGFLGTGAQAVARRARAFRADAVFYGGTPNELPDRLWRAVHRARPHAKLFGPDALTDPSFLRRIGAGAARATILASNVVPQSAFPPAAAPFFATFRARFGRAPRPYAIYGYEAMRLILDDLAAARAANPNADIPTLRDAVVAQFFATRDRASVLGTYSITATGDTTLGRFGIYRAGASGALRFDHVVEAKSP